MQSHVHKKPSIYNIYLDENNLFGVAEKIFKSSL